MSQPWSPADTARPRGHAGAAGDPRLQRRDGSHARRHEGRHGDERHRPRGAADAHHAGAAGRVGQPARRRPAPADLDRVDHEAARPALGVGTRRAASPPARQACTRHRAHRRVAAGVLPPLRPAAAGHARRRRPLHATTNSRVITRFLGELGEVFDPKYASASAGTDLRTPVADGLARDRLRGRSRQRSRTRRRRPLRGTPSSFCCGDRI